MTPAMIAALASGRATITGFFQLGLPSGTRHLLFGSTEVSWNGSTWVGYDPTIGSIDAVGDVTEDMGGTAPNTTLDINIAGTASLDDIAGEDAQLAPFKCWLAALTLDGSNHTQAVADPELLFDGFVDQITLTLDRGRNDMEFTVISAFDYFFENGEGQRLNGQFHQSVWTGEKGLDNVNGIDKKLYWGAYGPNSAGGSGGSSSIYGGGGGSLMSDSRYDNRVN